MSILDQQKILTLQQQLQAHCGTKLHLKINDNRSTMLSVKWDPGVTRVSMHWMFIHAPPDVKKALASYLRGDHSSLSPNIKVFIESTLQKLDYSYQLDLSKLQTNGKVYDLQSIYSQLNRIYFNRELNLHITWFGKSERFNRHRITFGLYHDALKLIKINRMLDNRNFPDYFVSYVIYHEMLHHVCPAYVDEKGIKHVHSKEFKEKEQQFPYYDLAQQWILENQDYLFGSPFHY